MLKTTEIYAKLRPFIQRQINESAQGGGGTIALSSGGDGTFDGIKDPAGTGVVADVLGWILTTDDGVVNVDAGGANTLTFSVAQGNISHGSISGIGTNTHSQIDTHIAATGTAVHGLGTMSTQAASAVAITGGSITGITDLAVADGGTGASDASGARTNLGLVIGTNVQAYDADLAAIAALAVTDGNIIVGNGSAWVAESGATARTSLGLGTGDSPEFTAVNLGHASDTTLTRVSAGLVAVEGDTVALLTATQTLTNKTISADNNTISGIAASSFVLSDASGYVDGSAAQKAIPSGVVVGTTDTQTLSAKTLTLPQINDTSADHQYVFAVSELAADRTVTLPLLAGNDVFVFADFTQTLTNKTLTTPTIGSFVNATHPHQDAAGGGTLDHGLALTGLTDDDHTQYLLATGTRTGASSQAQTFTTGVIDSSLTATRLLASNGSKQLASVASISSWIAGTTNRVTISDDGDGTATLTGPQDIHTAATPTFTTLTLSQATGTAPLTVSSTTKVANLNADLLDDLNTSSSPGAAAAVLATDANGSMALDTDTLYVSATQDAVWINSGTPDGSSALKVTSADVGDYTLYLKQLASQTADMVRIENSAGAALLLVQEDGDLESGLVGFVSGLAGWQITAGGDAEFNNIVARGEFHANTFVMDEFLVHNGTSVLVKSGGKPLYAATSLTTTTTHTRTTHNGDTRTTAAGDTRTVDSIAFSIDMEDPATGHAQLFQVGDILRVKDWTGSAVYDNWLVVNSAVDNTDYYSYFVTKMSGTATTFPVGAMVVDYGVSGNGGILSTAALSNAPYQDVFSITSTPWSSGIIGHLRTGKITGVGSALGTWGLVGGTDLSDTSLDAKQFEISDSGVYLHNIDISIYDSSNNPRVSLTSAGVFKLGTDVGAAATTGFAFDPVGNTVTIGSASYTGTVNIYGGITATSGSIAGPLTMSGASGSLALGVTPPTSATVGTGIWLDRTGLYGLSADVLQAKIGADGKLYAGGGNATMDSGGLSLEANPTHAVLPQGAVKWISSVWEAGATVVHAWAADDDSKIYGYLETIETAGKDSVLYLISNAPTGETSSVVISARVNGSGSSITVDRDNIVLAGITSLTLVNTGLHILDTNASHDLIVAPGSDLSADRTLTLTTGDADRTLTLTGNATLNQDVSTAASPAFAGLTVDTNVLHVDATNNRVGINKTPSGYDLDVNGDTRIGGDLYSSIGRIRGAAESLWLMGTGPSAVVAVDATNFRVGIGTDVLTPAYTLDVDGTARLTQHLRLSETGTTPSSLSSSAETAVYLKGDKFVIAFNDAGTTRYKYLDLTGTGVTWVHTTTAP